MTLIQLKKFTNTNPQTGNSQVFALRPFVDWISLGVAILLGLLARYVDLHIPW